jgi:prepilin-type N-terminal cleavage/methylation domain-containing protein
MKTDETGNGAKRRRGFTLTEVMVSMFITGLVVAGSFSSMIQIQRLWTLAETEIEGTGEAALALQKMVGGWEGNPGLRMAQWTPGVSPIITNINGKPYRIQYRFNGTNYWYQFDGSDTVRNQDGAIICQRVSQPFAFTIPTPGVVKIDLGLYRTTATSGQRYVRLATWTALRNR